MKRTDLAMEAHALWRQEAGETTELPGVKARSEQHGAVELTWVEILDETGAQALEKPVGTYVTLSLPTCLNEQLACREQAEALLTQQLTRLLPERQGTALVVGLGNAAVTPDAVGPRTAERLLVTRHLLQQLPDRFDALRPVCALSPGVLAATGLESAEVVRSVAQTVQPDCMIAVDALAAAGLERICSTIQLSNAGITPGSGVGNSRAAFDRASMGVPVLALGVPTVADASGLLPETQRWPLVVTPTDIDARLQVLIRIISCALNRALQPQLTREEIAEFAPWGD